MHIMNQNALTLGEAFLELMRQAVRGEIRTLIEDLREKDRLLRAQEAARMLAVSPDWLYSTSGSQGRSPHRVPASRQRSLRLNRAYAIGKDLTLRYLAAVRNLMSAQSAVEF